MVERTKNILKTKIGQFGSLLVQNAEILIFMAILLCKCILFNKVIGAKYGSTCLTLSCLGSILVLTSLSVWFKRRKRIIALLVLDALATVIMIADVIYYRYFNDVISTSVLMQVVLLDTLGDSIESLLKPIDLLFICDIIAGIVLSALFLRKIKDISSLWVRATKAVVLLLAGAGLIYSGYTNINALLDNRALSYVFDHTYFVENIGVLNYHGFDTYSFLSNKFFGVKRVPDSLKGEVRAAFASSDENKNDEKLRGVAKGYNLIVVQVEALQNLAINLSVEGGEVTPNLNKFAKRSIYFNNYYCQTMQGSTSDAEFLSNVSYYPLAEGSVYFNYTQNLFESLPKLLKKQGYNTMAMHPFRPSYWNRSSMYPVLGFDKFISANDYKIDELVGWGLSDRSFFIQSIEKMLKTPQPFHAFLITLSSHYPYDQFKPNEGLDVGKYNNTFYGNYLKSIHYADFAMGAFFDELEKQGLLDKSVVVIYGDHAAIQKKRLADLKDYLKLNTNDDIGWLKMIKVPLIIHLPEDREAGLRTNAGGQVDLLPTLANLLGISPQYCLGKDLLNTSESFAVLRDGSVTDGKAVYLKKYGKCFDIESGAEVDSKELESYVEFARKQLEISDAVIQNDLIRYYEGQKGK